MQRPGGGKWQLCLGSCGRSSELQVGESWEWGLGWAGGLSERLRGKGLLFAEDAGEPQLDSELGRESICLGL